MTDPVAIIARGAFAGTPVEPWQPIWSCASLRLARASWANVGLEAFLRMDIPYAATSSGRLSDDAVQLVLETLADSPPDHDYRFLELGAGSGIFAKLFLDRLAELAPEIYDSCRYVVSDGNASMLESQDKYGVLAAHSDHIEARVFDAGAPWPDDFSGKFDGIFVSYLLDSLPVDILSVGKGVIKRMEARSILTDASNDQASELRKALKTPGVGHLTGLVSLGKTLGLQTRHKPVSASNLHFAAAIPDKTEEEARPMVHCHGALACMENAGRALRRGGVAMFSDYGTTEPRDPSDSVEFQTFGQSAAHAVNFHQIDSYFGDAQTGVSLIRPDEEEGSLVTRVLYAGERDDLFELVDLLFGEARYRALTLPVEAAREMLRANAFQAARKLYAKAMELQPQNWALAEEVSEYLLLSAGEFQDAKDLAEFGLQQNPFSPGLHRIHADAQFQAGDYSGAQVAVEKSLALNDVDARTHLLHARMLVQRRDPKAALLAIAKGLACDSDGEYREQLITYQEEILVQISTDARDNLIVQVNRMRAQDGLRS